MKKSLIFASLLFASVAIASDVPSETKTGLTVDGQVNYVNEYVFRGYTVRDDAFNIQPEVTVGKSFDVGNYAYTPYVNLWANVTDEDYSRVNYFDELDVTAGFEIARGDFKLAFEYIYYTSPGDNFDDVHEVGAVLGYSHFLNPHVSVYQELKNGGDKDEGTYLEVGIAPEYAINDKFGLTFPVTFGSSLNDYYFDNDGSSTFLGYGAAGVVAKYTLDENWSVSVGGEYQHAFADSVEASNDGDENNLVFSVGVGFSY
mgnify:CR=1 FL=1